MRITYLLVASSLLVITLFSPCNIAIASSDETTKSQINPSSPLYFLKTIRENFELKFAGNKRITMLRQLEFATRRIREANTLVTLDQDLIPPTLEKYAAHLKNVIDIHEENDDLGNRIKENLNFHLNILRQMYPQVSNTRARMSIKTALYRIIQRPDITTDKRSPVCELFIKEASSSALNQTERVVWAERGQKCQSLNE